MPFLVVLISLLAALGLASQADGRQSFQTQVTIDYHNDGEFVWDGKVKSSKQGCITDRKVILRNDAIDEPLDHDRAKANGEYEIRQGMDGLSGDYYTRVKSLDRSGYGCKGDRSPKIPLS